MFLILVLKINYRELFIVWALTPQAEDPLISKLKTLSSKYVRHALDWLVIGHRSKNQASLEFLSLYFRSWSFCFWHLSEFTKESEITLNHQLKVLSQCGQSYFINSITVYRKIFAPVLFSPLSPPCCQRVNFRLGEFKIIFE